ncbi:NYN domain-containing protein [Shewanella sp. UCD-KL21]|uniref:NYN domain-containing protein n=1 Tax=Shewanella sp. UCD-KL21 TaxID=1917164 RepID=UPI00097101BF|nr:NYN domain-containing protein [Shewanella sp. UCD-KL21]
MSDLTFAVLVDAENASQNQYESMLNEVERYGTVAIKWIYADWTMPNQKSWQSLLHKTASSPKQQFHYGKDAADHALVMDAIELIGKNSRINAVCIVSSDGGFYSLAQRVREYGLHVMAIGRENTPERFRKACHNFVLSKNLLSTQESIDKSDLDTLLLNAFHRCADTNEPVYLGDLGSMLKSLDSSFDPRTYHYTSLKRLIKGCEHLFEVVNESNDRCFISLTSNVQEGCEITNGKIRSWLGNKNCGFIETSSGDFYFKAEDIIEWNGRDVKVGTEVSFLAAKYAAPTVNRDSNKCPKARLVTLVSNG